METSHPARAEARAFLRFGLLALIVGLLAGAAGVLQYLLPEWGKEWLSFRQLRPIHVSSVLFWILSASVGLVIGLMQDVLPGAFLSVRLLRMQRTLMMAAGVLILLAYLGGRFGGREYAEYPPVLALLILASWALFAYQFFRGVKGWKQQPVYVWMWGTGVVAFLYTFTESYLWTLPWFRRDAIADLTIQWKAAGSMVGSWNMLIYGSGLCILDRVRGDETYSRSRLAFWLYLTGLTNLMFNWGHHIYTVPVPPLVRGLSYAVSMTELFILGRILYTWSAGLNEGRKFLHRGSQRLLLLADHWVLFNLMLAIAMSVPVINLYTHGTHVTVAHAMGATIGINTLMLFGGIVHLTTEGTGGKSLADLKRPLQVLHYALLAFWLTLITAGVLRAVWQMDPHPPPFHRLSEQLRPVYAVLLFCGWVLALSLGRLAYRLFRSTRH